MERKVAPPFVASLIAELGESYDFSFMDDIDDVVFETDHGDYGVVEWRPDSAHPQLVWSSHVYWHVADESGDESSHVVRIDLDIGVNFQDHIAPIVVSLDFIENPMRDWDVTVHVCMSIRSEEEWTRFKSEHLDSLYERADKIAENMCETWSGNDTDDSEESI